MPAKTEGVEMVNSMKSSAPKKDRGAADASERECV
jgi:hypothetical protein